MDQSSKPPTRLWTLTPTKLYRTIFDKIPRVTMQVTNMDLDTQLLIYRLESNHEDFHTKQCSALRWFLTASFGPRVKKDKVDPFRISPLGLHGSRVYIYPFDSEYAANERRLPLGSS